MMRANRRDLCFVTICGVCMLSLFCGACANAQMGPPKELKLPPSFEGKLLYQVPEQQGSWVSMTSDPQGRLIVSDQYGGLYRITLAGDDQPQVEWLDVKMGFAQGLLCAFDSLYAVSYGVKEWNKPPGLYRLRDTNNDDQYDELQLLREISGGGEHGQHAVILSPDGQSLYVCAGNHTDVPELSASRVPRNWQEDQVLTRLPDAGGHAVGKMAPGGWICKTDPDGKEFELISAGYRNEYDIDFDPNGELFTYDADMEWDVGLPWYRPTRICHATSGSEFGWRHGSGKWPEYYADSVPSVNDVGPGSPTGVVFGTGAKFPSKYQNALFAADWSYGKIYAIHLQPNGATYSAEREEFCSAPALPVTDLVINPTDGALYFLIGGRNTQSALYRVRYTGDESTAPASYPAPNEAVAMRRRLEMFHRSGADADFDLIWEQLGSDDRALRYAARIALEHQPVETWAERALQERDTTRLLESLTALIRNSDQSRQAEIVAALDRLKWQELTQWQQLHLLRAYGLVLCRLGEPTSATNSTIQQLKQHFPTGDDRVDRELAKLLVAAGTPSVTELVVELLLSPRSLEAQIDYAKTLSDAHVGWTNELHQRYFQWYLDVANSKGGHSYAGYLQNIKNHAIEGLTDDQQSALSEILNKKPEQRNPYAELEARPLVQEWTLDDLLPSDDSVFEHRDLANGKKMFALANCYSCHRIDREGGLVGPDLTPAGRRFNTKDLLEAIVDPSKTISDQYQATIFRLDDGRTIVGRVANLHGKNYQVQQDMIDPGNLTGINVDSIESMSPSDISVMPAGLLNRLTKDEILDLLAYLKSTAP